MDAIPHAHIALERLRGGGGIEIWFRPHHKAQDVTMSTTLQFLEQLHQKGVGRKTLFQSERVSHPVKNQLLSKGIQLQHETRKNI